MNNIDEIRAKLEANDILSAGAIDEVIRIIAPYISHGITEEEARTWFNAMSYSPNQLEFMIEGKNLGLITPSREPIAESENNSQINNWCKERDEILRLCVESDSNFARKVFNFCGMSSDLISCLKTEMDTNKLRQPIAEPESLVKARENYEVRVENNGTTDLIKDWGDLINERDYCIDLVEELEARVKELEGK